MKNKFTKYAWSIVLVFTLACNFTFTIPTPSTESTATLESPTLPVPSETSAVPAGVDVSYAGTHFVIPNGLATGATNEIKPKEGADFGIPYLAHPDYAYFQLQGYPLQREFIEPHIAIYPVQEYEQINESVPQAINDLQTVLAAQSTSPDMPIPFLPFQNASQVFHAQEKFISFQNGTGVRYITQFDQAPLPINNQSMYYTFQGLTSDGAYLISVVMPVNLDYLPENDKPNGPTPEGGVPFDWEHIENFPNYLTSIVEKLSRSDNTFNPTLETLDRLVETLLVTKQ